MIVETVAGGAYGFGGDGGPATAARIHYYGDIDVGPDGIMDTVAGSGPTGWNAGAYAGDGGPATAARLNVAYGVAVGPNGSFYVSDAYNYCVRRADSDGIIDTVAGQCETEGLAVDGGPALQPAFGYLTGVDVGPDGSLYVVDKGNSRVWRVGTDGVIRLLAGRGTCPWGDAGDGDGGPATEALLCDPEDIEVGPDGSVYVSHYYPPTVRLITPDGIITTLPGTGEYGFSEDGTSATEAQLAELGELALAWISTWRNRHNTTRQAALIIGW